MDKGCVTLECGFLDPNRSIREDDLFQGRAAVGPGLEDPRVHGRNGVSPMIEIVYAASCRAIEVENSKFVKSRQVIGELRCNGGLARLVVLRGRQECTDLS